MKKGPPNTLKSDCNTVHYKVKIDLRQANPRPRPRMLSYRGTKKTHLFLRYRPLSIHRCLGGDSPGEWVALTAWVLAATSRYINLNTGIALDGPQSGLTNSECSMMCVLSRLCPGVILREQTQEWIKRTFDFFLRMIHLQDVQVCTSVAEEVSFWIYIKS